MDAIRSRRIYDLAEPLSAATPHSPSHPGVTLALLRRHGDAVREDGGSSAFEALHMGVHTGTHIDALCHGSVEGTMFGNVPATTTGGVFATNGIDEVEPFFCRGVLLDIPWALGREALDAGHRITKADLEVAAERAGVEVGEGDVVLVRTGRPLRRFADLDDGAAIEAGVPGVDLSGAKWLAERRVRAAGSDTIAFEWLPAGRGAANMPVHTLLLCRAGINIIELLHLEELSRDGVYQFVFAAAPLKLVGATGSPLRPFAVVSAD